VGRNQEAKTMWGGGTKTSANLYKAAYELGMMTDMDSARNGVWKRKSIVWGRGLRGGGCDHVGANTTLPI